MPGLGILSGDICKMIDICGIFNFEKELENINTDVFLSAYRRDIYHAGLKEVKLTKGNIFYRGNEESCLVYFNQAIYIFVFGTVFTNQNYSNTESGKSRILNPSDLFDFYNKFNTGMAKFIKGNFVIIIYDDNKKELIFISSKLNTLPLFYYYKGKDFIFSSMLKLILHCQQCSPQLNVKSILESFLFFCPLENKTYFNDIFQLPPATIFIINSNGIRTEKYFSLEDFFDTDEYFSEDEALERCINLMKNNLILYTQDAPKFLLSLTGGFDSRVNLALLNREAKDFLCYSYGMPGSRQIEIPLLISKKLGLNYMPVYLDAEFEKEYERCALKALDFSNGTAPILRANFPYVFEKLNYFSKVNITGLFGSEVIKIFHRANEQVSQETFDLFLNEDFDTTFVNILGKLKKIGYLKSDIIDRYLPAVREDFRKLYMQRLQSFDRTKRFYIFLFEETIRKYFMKEIGIERYYVDTRTPYFDEEFLELFLRTPFAGVYKRPGKKNVFSRRHSQLFYAKLIQMAKPVLGEIITDRGYSPKDLLLPFILKSFKIAPVYLKERLRRKIKGNDTFKSEEWSRNLIGKYIYKLNNYDEIFTDKLIKDFENNTNFRDNFRFFSIFSFRLWLHLLNDKVI